MKFCTKCGAEIEDTVVVCPKCGNAVNSKNYSSPQNTTVQLFSNVNSANESSRAILMMFKIIASLATAIGTILLLIGGVQEIMFRVEYADSLKNLTSVGVKLVRQFTDYSKSIDFLTYGGIVAGVGFVIELILLLYRSMLKK